MLIKKFHLNGSVKFCNIGGPNFIYQDNKHAVEQKEKNYELSFFRKRHCYLPAHI